MTQITVKDESEAQDRTGAPVISVRAVTKRYGDAAAVDRIDLDVREGEFISLLGPSGCGKTTLLRMLGGFEDPDEGEIELHGRSVLGIPPHKRTVNTVFQAYALFPHMTVAENVAYGLRQRKVPRSEVAARVTEVLRLVRMVEYADRPPRKLSGGQQQRVALARAIVNRPSVLLLDEPMSALDRNLREQMQIELKLIQRRVGITFLFVTHDQEEALSMSDRIVVMQKGTIKQIGTAQEVYEKPATAFVAEFIGKQNFFGGTVAAGGTIDADETSFRPSPERLKAFPSGTQVEVGLRAETVTVHAAEPDADTNQMRGTLAGTSFLGDVLQHVVVTGAGREVLVRTPASSATPLEVGSTVWCSWDPGAVQVFDAEEGLT